MEYVVDLIWDDEAKVWIAIGDTETGLILESDSIERLIERVKLATPELLYQIKGSLPKTINFCFKIQYDVSGIELKESQCDSIINKKPFTDIITAKQDWIGDLYFDPDSSPEAWEFYKKYYSKQAWTSNYNFEELHFFEFANDGSRLYVDFPLSFYNRLNALYEKSDPTDKDGLLYYPATLRLAGETDFNFNDKKYEIFLKILFKDYKRDKTKFYENLSKLKDCNKMHHTLANFSLTQVVGNMQGFKSKGLCLTNGKNEWLDRLDTFIYMLNEFYNKDLGNRNEDIIIKNAGPYNGGELLNYLNGFNSIFDYCEKVYFIKDKLVNKLIALGSKEINTGERVVEYMDLALDFWKERVEFLLNFE